MITVMDSIKDSIKSSDNGLDSQLWHACAGGMVQLPSLNSKVFYFPQGHSEHANRTVDFGNSPIPPLVPCRVSAIRFMADPETDEVYAKMRLIPSRSHEFDFEDDDLFVGGNEADESDKPASFAKTLTQSDANNGGGFSVPRYCAETIFPRLDYAAEPPVQTILAKDVHGETWKFRHIYRGTPRRHLLTTGWSNFVNQKKLVAGDSIVFLRTDSGELCVGIRRAKRGIGGGAEYTSGWNSGAGSLGFPPPYGGYSRFVSEDEMRLNRRNGSYADLKGRVRAESVVEATNLAAGGKHFEVVYYPRSSTPEFVVKAPAVRAAMQIQWCSGMRFKMPFETEDSSRISWFMGTISAVQVADPVRWPTSPWRLLQVAWDEPDLLQNVKCVSPWLVELVSTMPTIHFSPFAPQRKKFRLSHHSDFQNPMAPFSSNPLRPDISETVSAGIQGARHAHYGLSPSFHHHTPPKNPDNPPCLLTSGNLIPAQQAKEKNDGEAKTPHFVLFGQVILTEEQISQSCSNDTVGNSSSDGNVEKATNSSDEVFARYKDERGLETGHCRIFIDSGSDVVGR